MMEQERDYQAIYIKDLLFSILYRWKIVVIAMIIGALLMYGLNVLDTLTASSRPAKKITGEEQTQREQVQQVLEDTDVRIETQRIYLSTSPLMSIDPNNFYQANLTLYIQTEYKINPGLTYQDPDYVPAILAAYQQILTDGEVLAKLAEETNLPGQYLHELITVTSITSHPGILSITINAADEETATQLLQMLKNEIVAAEPSIESLTDKEHTLIAQDHAPILRADTNIADMQKAAFQRLTTLQDQKIEWQKQQTSLNISGAEANPALVAAIGAAIGLVLAVVFICISHIANNKVYSVRTLKNRTGMKVLGCIKQPGKIGIFQRWLRKQEGRCSNDAHLSIIVAILQNYCGKNGRVMLTSSNSNLACEELLDALKAAQVPCTVHNCLLNDPAALRALPESDAVILLEQCNYSHHAQIDQTIQIINDEEIPLLGCVLIGG